MRCMCSECACRAYAVAVAARAAGCRLQAAGLACTSSTTLAMNRAIGPTSRSCRSPTLDHWPPKRSAAAAGE